MIAAQSLEQIRREAPIGFKGTVQVIVFGYLAQQLSNRTHPETIDMLDLAFTP